MRLQIDFERGETLIDQAAIFLSRLRGGFERWTGMQYANGSYAPLVVLDHRRMSGDWFQKADEYLSNQE